MFHPELFILHPSKTFDHLVLALAPYPLDIRDVRSCTFPGQPEPQSAKFVHTHDAQDVLIFNYLPDLQLRAILLTADIHTTLELAPHITLLDLLGHHDDTPWLEHWSDLRHALFEDAHIKAQRAAAAWRLRGALASHTTQQKQLCQEVLTEGLLDGSLSARRACAEQLIKWPQREFQDALSQARMDDDDVEVRMHAQRALDEIERFELTH